MAKSKGTKVTTAISLAALNEKLKDYPNLPIQVSVAQLKSLNSTLGVNFADVLGVQDESEAEKGTGPTVE